MGAGAEFPHERAPSIFHREVTQQCRVTLGNDPADNSPRRYICQGVLLEHPCIDCSG